MAELTGDLEGGDLNVEEINDTTGEDVAAEQAAVSKLTLVITKFALCLSAKATG